MYNQGCSLDVHCKALQTSVSLFRVILSLVFSPRPWTLTRLTFRCRCPSYSNTTLPYTCTGRRGPGDASYGSFPWRRQGGGARRKDSDSRVDFWKGLFTVYREVSPYVNHQSTVCVTRVGRRDDLVGHDLLWTWLHPTVVDPSFH